MLGCCSDGIRATWSSGKLRIRFLASVFSGMRVRVHLNSRRAMQPPQLGDRVAGLLTANLTPYPVRCPRRFRLGKRVSGGDYRGELASEFTKLVTASSARLTRPKLSSRLFACQRFKIWPWLWRPDLVVDSSFQ